MKLMPMHKIYRLYECLIGVSVLIESYRLDEVL